MERTETGPPFSSLKVRDRWRQLDGPVGLLRTPQHAGQKQLKQQEERDVLIGMKCVMGQPTAGI